MSDHSPSYPEHAALRHFARRTMTGSIEIVDRQFDFVRALLPYDYAFTCNAQQWDEAERICQALEGPMISQGIVSVAQGSGDCGEINALRMQVAGTKAGRDFHIDTAAELLALLTAIIDTNQEFRDGMPKAWRDGHEWEGDPLQDAIDAAARFINLQGPTVSSTSFSTPPASEVAVCTGGVDPGWDECPKCGATMDDACAFSSPEVK